VSNTQCTLILLDVDGVLVHPVGYKAALRATVNHFAARMGQPEMGPDDDEIAVFEACGLTNEWDSGALCVSAILLAVLDQRPDLYRPTLVETLAAAGAAGVSIPRPDFVSLAHEVARTEPDSRVPSAHYLAQIADRVDSATLPLLAALLGDVYAIGTPTTRVFQTHTLGSQRFEAAYGQPSPFESVSFLAEYDIPLLDDGNRDRLLRWLYEQHHGAAIFTARPSLPPADLPGVHASGYAPEAELAVELLGLAEAVPLMGQGRVGWLAERRGRTAANYVKPSPVQALAAIGAALSGPESAALEAAAILVEEGVLTGPLATLADRPAHVIVFEDATGGVRATRQAVEQLKNTGLGVTFEAVGVSPHRDKRAALAEVANHVVDDVNEGLALIIGACSE
jgi:hypothetical protein